MRQTRYIPLGLSLSQKDFKTQSLLRDGPRSEPSARRLRPRPPETKNKTVEARVPVRKSPTSETRSSPVSGKEIYSPSTLEGGFGVRRPRHSGGAVEEGGWAGLAT